MTNRGKRTFAAFASAILLAASALIATPVSAQSGGGEYVYYNCNDPTTGSTGGYYGSGYGCCEYDPWLEGWYRRYSWGYESCTPPWEAPEPPSLEPAAPSGR